MVGMVEFAALSTALRNASDLTKILIGIKVDENVKAKVAELQAAIMSAQSRALDALAAQAAQQEEIRSLKAEAAEREEWLSQAKRYALKQFSGGALCYELKSEEAAGEPAHCICPKCFQERHRSILQMTSKTAGEEMVECPRCKASFRLADKDPAQVEQNRRAFRNAMSQSGRRIL